MIGHPVRTELFYREDIRTMLIAMDDVNRDVLAHIPGAQAAAYRAGFEAAIQAVAGVFDVDVSPRKGGRMWKEIEA